MSGHVLILFCFWVSFKGIIIVLAVNDTRCHCGYRQSGNTMMLRCASNKADLPSSKFFPVFCHRVGETVRIGDSKTFNVSKSPGMSIEPSGLSRLQEGDRVSVLQLNIPLQARFLDALAFAGLPDLTTLHAWRAPIALEACSLAGLSRLEHVVINCKSTFEHFLTFSNSFKSIRLTGCRGKNLQFICSRCTQRPEVSVLRVLPGPPSVSNTLGFTNDVNDPLTWFTCQPGVCSEDHLCRHNMPLKLAHSNPFQQISKVPTISPELSLIMSSSKPRNRYLFLAIFLPIFLLTLTISCTTCIVFCLMISGEFRKKSYHSQGINRSRQEVRVTSSSSWSSSMPLNNF